jgi:hypothetical protein
MPGEGPWGKSVKAAVVRRQGRDRPFKPINLDPFKSTYRRFPMNTRSTILSLAALATLSVSALAPTQASAWGSRDGYSYGSHRSMGYFGRSFRARFSASQSCSTESAPAFRRSFASRGRFAEGGSFETQGYSSAPQRGFASMRQAQGYGASLPQHGRPGFRPRGHDSYEEVETQESQQLPQANPDNGPTEYSSKELQR